MTHRTPTLGALTLAGLALLATPATASDIFPDKLVTPGSIEAGSTAEVVLEVSADLDSDTPFPLDVVLVLDASETMGQPISKYFDAIDVAREIAEALAPPGDRVALITFAGMAGAVQQTDLENDSVQDTVNALDAQENVMPMGVTPIGDGLDAARTHLETVGREDAVWLVVLLSDGIDTGGAAESAAGAVKQLGITLVTVSFGDLDDQHPANLMNLVLPTSSDHHFHEPGFGELDDLLDLLFDEVARACAREVEVLETLGDGLEIQGPVLVELFPGPFTVDDSSEPVEVVGNDVTLLIHVMRDDDEYRLTFDVTAEECGDLEVDAPGSRVEWIRPDGTEGSEDFPAALLSVTDDQPPEIECPADVELEADAACQAVYQGPPATAEDCGGDPTVTPDLPIVLDGVGEHVVEWTATGVDGLFSSCEQTITVVDVTAPTLVGVPADTSVECDAVPPPPPVDAVDNCDPDPQVGFAEMFAAGACVGEGTLTRTWTASDASGNQSMAQQVIEVVDTTPPEVVPGADAPVCLWPPNHKLVLLAGIVAGVELVDNCDPDPGLTVLGCVSDQCDDAPCAGHPGENGDGRTVNDCNYDEQADVLSVRAERAGTEPEGRNYALTGQAVDSCGNQSGVLELFGVHVPHDQSPAQECIAPEP